MCWYNAAFNEGAANKLDDAIYVTKGTINNKGCWLDAAQVVFNWGH